MKIRRVVVTGMGAVTPIGNSVQEFWSNAIAGISGAEPITKFDTANFKTQFACEVKNFDPTKYLDRNEIRRTDLFTQYALHSSSEALADSQLDLSKVDPFEIGVIWGSGQGGMETFENEVGQYASSNGIPRFNPFFIPKIISNMAPGMISMKYGLMGVNYTTVSACATSNNAIMEAYHSIKYGRAKVMITGGSEASVTQASIGGFNAMKSLSTRNDDPGSASRPFDISRDGFVMGEGGGALVLEDLEHAETRGAHIYAEVVGAAMTADAYHMTSTHPEGLGAAKAMELAMKEANISIKDIEYINCHATSTGVGDVSEIKAIETVFGEQEIHISATKSMTGHLLGAAGAVEAILSIKAIQDSFIPPTINTQNIDPCVPDTIKLVLGKPKQHMIKYAMSTSFGFGGHNAIVIFKRLD